MLGGDEGGTSKEAAGRDMTLVEKFTTGTMTSEAKGITPPRDSTLTYSIIYQKETEVTTHISRRVRGREGRTPSTKRKDKLSKSTRCRQLP